MENLQQSLGKRIRQIRKERGLTQEDFARRIGIDYKHLGSIERGNENVTIQTIEKICRAIDITPSEIFVFSSMKRPHRKKATANFDAFAETLRALLSSLDRDSRNALQKSVLNNARLFVKLLSRKRRCPL